MKHLIRNFFTLSCLAIAGILSNQSNAQAVSISFDSVSNDNYNSSITLDAGESLSSGNVLLLTNVQGITSATTPVNSPFELSTIGGGFSTINANALFEVSDSESESGPVTLSNVIQINATGSLDNVEYKLFASDSFSGAVTNNSTSVPFEFSPGLGIAIATGFFGWRFLKNTVAERLKQ
ncbi:exported hypothetical protein [Hyella patelloides LEGE 07179]|uniref:Uncharacterized protein n=1 Tax=Hyella patelloides LEGE 07179 TaxID=945734 RepID=A0A563VTV8_9CYAN|nr:hypothetical protein [Hyella patelloides]VEP14835.1 exported hypothetical protein [Hyella patelloides LEGE 07179]